MMFNPNHLRVPLVVFFAAAAVHFASAQEGAGGALPQSAVPAESPVDQALDQIEHNGLIGQKQPASNKEFQPQILELEPLEAGEDLPAPIESVPAGDKPTNPIIETKIIPLLHAEAASIVETLEGMKSDDGVVTYDGENRALILKDHSAQLESMAAYVKSVDIPLETKVYQLEHIAAEAAEHEIKNILTGNVGQVQVVEGTNNIVVTDTPLKIGEVTELVASLDKVDKKIVIDAKVLQIILNDEHADGVDWEAIVSDYQSLPFDGFTDDVIPDAVVKKRKVGKLNFGAVTKDDFRILVEALDTVGIVSEISEQTVTMENSGTNAVNVASAEGRRPKAESEGPVKTKNVEFIISPEIGQEEDLLAVTIKAVSVGEAGTTDPDDSDGKVVVHVQDGATIVIGSLFEEVKVESSWKIPLLGDLPLLGFVFRNQGEVPRRAEIITFLTVKTMEKK